MSPCPFSVLPLRVGWLVFMLLSHEPSREGMAPVSGVSAKLSAGSVTGIQADGSWKDPRSWSGTQGPHPPKILMLYFFNLPLLWEDFQIQE